ncbi:ParB/RepB/Spo0J family partition protein [Tissierella sp. MB52-C2]|uniref:ParB/RepB/Spo0J family partition protein n=1 Tax=Tissierella sp. MB52-C2 TaxID=3070999 RepID=UPI00280BB84F|nr:ParB/RepB/Spo0J family partition protein [Tissierella sp. MB52-C2]WMM26687.1 ParB/RepB/Spo0J family partition protein [Tissierella sp. MB52-C2]
MIKFIRVDKIFPHPHNPRKDLGDVTELAESIKESGVLQNLTIVPEEEGYCLTCSAFNGAAGKCQDEHDKTNSPPCKNWEPKGEYTVIIGHRRLAAAKLAGLKEVPCAIIEMDKKTQVATMLLENMQRVDLTVYEQAQGFQMMLELGESVTNISEKTGFSESTVRRRMKLLELDQEKLKESTSRGGTLMDYVELEKIQDIELRNEVLEKVGTHDFHWTLRNAIDKEKRYKRTSEIIEQLNEFATKVESRSNILRYVKSYSTSSDETIERPSDVADTVRYFYEVGQYHITLYKEDTGKDIETEAEKQGRLKRERKESRRVALKEISERAYKLRSDFVKEISNTKSRKNMNTIIEATLYASVDRYNRISSEKLAEIMGIEATEKEDKKIEWKDIVNHIWKQPELYLLQSTYHSLDNKEDYLDWQDKYKSNEELDYVYEFLKKLGYKMSEEEKQLQDGTHELFKDDEEE